MPQRLPKVKGVSMVIDLYLRSCTGALPTAPRRRGSADMDSAMFGKRCWGSFRLSLIAKLSCTVAKPWRTTAGSWLMSLGSTPGTMRARGTSAASRLPTFDCILQPHWTRNLRTVASSIPASKSGIWHQPGDDARAARAPPAGCPPWDCMMQPHWIC